MPRRGKQILEESGLEYIVGTLCRLIWDTVRKQTLIQLIQKVILDPLKAILRAVGRPERNRQPRMRKGERREKHKTCDFRDSQKEKSRRTKTRNFFLRDFSNYQRADRLFLPIPLEKISEEGQEEREGREKVGDFRPR